MAQQHTPCVRHRSVKPTLVCQLANKSYYSRCPWLGHGDERRYDTTFSILPDTESIAAAEKRITDIAAQPDADYPAPSGDFRPIGGRS